MPRKAKEELSDKMSAKEVLALMKSEFKKSSVKLLSEESVGTVSTWVDMNNCSLNYIISGDLTKGFPYGRVVEYHGDNSTGKTLVALQCVANAQKQNDAIVFYFDPECSLDREFAKKLGADPDNIIYDDKIDTVEELESRIEGIIRMKETSELKQPILIILDSLAMLSTAHEMDAPDKNDMTKAKKLKQITRRLTRRMAHNQIGFLVLNHTIANIAGGPWAPKQTTTGGSAIPFLASVRLKTSIFKKVRDPKTKEVVGVMIKVECVKNKLTRPFRSAILYFDYRILQIDKYSGLPDLLVAREIFKKIKLGTRNGFEYKDERFVEKELGKYIEEKGWLKELNESLSSYETANKDSIDVTNVEFEDDEDKEAEEVDEETEE
jgi:recombination protein RecA